MVDIPVYLDNHATTACDPRVLEAMLPWFTRDYGNASSRQHAFGLRSSEGVKNARQSVADLIGCSPEEIIFTSGATESVNLALKGCADMYAAKGRHIITCATEHAAVLDTCKSLERAGFRVSILGVDGQGRVDMNALSDEIGPDTILAAIMLANNETGLIQDIRKASAICREKNVLFFTDATQAVGKIPVDVEELGVDMLCLSAHKFYGPKGVGALYVRRKNPRVRLSPMLDGGGHEKGMRSGTLNVPGIVGLGKAASLAADEMGSDMERVGSLRNRMEETLLREEEVFVNCAHSPRLPTVSNISFRFTEGQALLGAICREVAISSGSACSSASMEPSHVLTAMGLGRDLAYATLRISLGRYTSVPEIQFAENVILKAVRTMRQQGQLWSFARDTDMSVHENWVHPDLKR
jgi:cysteine desulfurase